MANGHGGYRKPTNPAPVSGPGALSARTDTAQPAMRLPDAAYGEQAAFQMAQSGAPMAGPDAGPAGAGGPTGPSPVEVTPFGSPSTMPDQPITAGIDMGAGPGSAALGLVDEDAIRRKADTDALARYLPVLEFLANRPEGSASLKALVRRLKASS